MRATGTENAEGDIGLCSTNTVVRNRDERVQENTRNDEFQRIGQNLGEEYVTRGINGGWKTVKI